MATFGKTTIGDTSNTSWPPSNVVVSLSQFTLNDAIASISKLTTFSSVINTATEWKGFIYSDVSDNPVSLLAATLPASILTNQFIDLPFSSNVILNGGKYWLGVMGDGQGLTTSASATGINRISGPMNAYPSVTGTFQVTSSTISVNQKPIYATYIDSWNFTMI